MFLTFFLHSIYYNSFLFSMSTLGEKNEIIFKGIEWTSAYCQTPRNIPKSVEFFLQSLQESSIT